MFVCIRVAICRFGRRAKASRVADDWLVDVFPERARVDEHFVIETSRHKAAKLRVQRTYIIFKARPVVLAFGFEALKQFSRGDALVWLKLAALAHLDQSVWFFRTRGHNAARAVVLERTAHQDPIIGKQGRGKRVALEPFEGCAIEAKAKGFGFVQQAAACGKTCAHDVWPWSCAEGLGASGGDIFREQRRVMRKPPMTSPAVWPR